MSCGSAGVLSEMEGESAEGHRQPSHALGSPAVLQSLPNKGCLPILVRMVGSSARSDLIVSPSWTKEDVEKALWDYWGGGSADHFLPVQGPERDKQVCSLSSVLQHPCTLPFEKVLFPISAHWVSSLPLAATSPQISHIWYAEYSKFIPHVLLLSEKQVVLSQRAVTFLVFHRHLCSTLLCPEANSPFPSPL